MTSIATALNYFDALHAIVSRQEDRIADLTAENTRLRGELAGARNQAADANARAAWQDMTP